MSENKIQPRDEIREQPQEQTLTMNSMQNKDSTQSKGSVIKVILMSIVLVLVMIGCLVIAVRYEKNKEKQVVRNEVSAALEDSHDVQIIYREQELLVEVEKTITASIIQDGLNDIGFLITQQYYFTEVISYSSIKQIFGFDLGFTETSYLGSYDGEVTAGIDFTKITVEKDDESKIVTIHLPEVEIRNIDLDPESFVLYSETSGIGNPVSVEDFNRSLVELESNARNKAVEKGVLEQAKLNARYVVRNFVESMLAGDGYVIVFAED